MNLFEVLWLNHPGREFVCDPKLFPTQCAMRMGEAMRKSGIPVPYSQLRTCVRYNRNRFRRHAPGHILAAHDLARLIEKRPDLIGCTTGKTEKMKGTILDNKADLIDRYGMVFIRDGWGRTDHIDLIRGDLGRLVGGITDSSSDDFRTKGKEIWFWEMQSAVFRPTGPLRKAIRNLRQP